MAATTSATTSVNPTSSIVLSPAGSGSTLAAVKKTRFVDHGGLQRRWQDVDGAGPVAAGGCNLDMVDGLMGRSLVVQFTAAAAAAAADDAGQSLRPRKLRDQLLGTENSGWSRPAGLIIDPVRESPPQEAAEAGLCSSSATPHHDADRRLLASASSLDNYNRRQKDDDGDDDVARAAPAGKLSDAAAAGGRVPKEEAERELQNEAASAGLVRKSSECTTTHAPAAEETRDCPRAAVGTEDNAAVLAAGALLDLSSSLVDEGYNTSSIGSSTGNVIESEKHPGRKQQGEAGEFGSLEPETSGSNDEDKEGRSCTKLKMSDEPKLAQQQTEKRRRSRTAWADFETDVSAGKKRRKSGESNKGIINMASAAAQAPNPSVLLGPTQGRKSGEGKKKKSSIVMDVQETSVLPRPAHRKRYRPIAQLMQETPVVDAVYNEEEEEEEED